MYTIGSYRVLIRGPEGKKLLRKPRRRLKYNIKMYLQEDGMEGIAWIDLIEDGESLRALVNAVMSIRVP
jgi:hypothetical protein